MAIKNILTEPNKILRQVSKVVEKVGNEERQLMDDMLDTIMMGGRGARRYTEDLQKFSGDGVISIAFRSEFESSDTCDEFEQVLGAPTSASGCDVAHLQQLNFREYLKQGSESGKSESLYICT